MCAYYFDTVDIVTTWLNTAKSQQKDINTFTLLGMFFISNIIETETGKASKI